MTEKDDERPEGAATDAPPAEGADEARTDAGAGADDGDANGKVSIPRHEYEAREREKAAAAALREENARLKAEAESRRTAPPTADDSKVEDLQSQIAEEEAYIRELQAAKEAGNRDAGALVAVHRSILREKKELLAIEERMMFRMEMQDVPEAERGPVYEYMKATGVTRPSVARQLMRGSKYETLEQENARLKAELAARSGGRGKPAVEDTRIVGSPGGARAPAKKGAPITLDEYNERMRKDPAATTAARKAGEFTIKVG